MSRKTAEKTTSPQNDHHVTQRNTAGDGGLAVVPPSYMTAPAGIFSGGETIQAKRLPISHDVDLKRTANQRLDNFSDTRVPNRWEAPVNQRLSGPIPSPAQLQAIDAPAENHTGMPNQLKSGLEHLSGLDLSGIRVYYNSPKPAQISALAYTQGQQIYLGPSQEQHMPHEGWHAVQQLQGRVTPTLQGKGWRMNDDTRLEHEADVMGQQAIRHQESGAVPSHLLMPSSQQQLQHPAAPFPGRLAFSSHQACRLEPTNSILSSFNSLPETQVDSSATPVPASSSHKMNEVVVQREAANPDAKGLYVPKLFNKESLVTDLASSIALIAPLTELGLSDDAILSLCSLHGKRTKVHILEFGKALKRHPEWKIGRFTALAEHFSTIDDIEPLMPLHRSTSDIISLSRNDLANHVPAITVSEIVQLDALSNDYIHKWLRFKCIRNASDLIQLQQTISRENTRSGEDLYSLIYFHESISIDIRNTDDILQLSDIITLAHPPMINGLGEFVVQDCIKRVLTKEKWIEQIRDASLEQRQAILRNRTLRSLISTRFDRNTAIMATLLEGLFYARKAPSGKSADIFDPQEGYRIRNYSQFASWILGGNEYENQPSITAFSSMMNWEGILFALYLGGMLSYRKIHDSYMRAAKSVSEHASALDAPRSPLDPTFDYFLPVIVEELFDIDIPFYKYWDPLVDPAPVLLPGLLVFFVVSKNDGLHGLHAAISLGGRGGDAEVMIFWRASNRIRNFQRLTINEVLAELPHYEIFLQTPQF